MAKRVVGVDFGHGVIRGVEVEEPGTKRQRVVRQGSVPVAPDAVASGEVRDIAAVAAALKQLWGSAGFKAKEVVLGLGNARVLARDLEVPVRPMAQVREGLPFLVADLLPMPLENAVLDYYPISVTRDDAGVEMYNGMLVAALKDVAMANTRAAKQAGLDVVGIDMIPFAIIRTLADRASGESVAFVDVGATTTIISVATAGVPEFVRTVPVGSEDVSRSLMELGQLSREQAEQVKRTVGLSAEGVEPRYRPVVELMVTRTSDLMTSIRDTLSYFADTRQRRIDRIVLTGGGARLGGFAQMVSAWTRIPAGLDETFPDMDYLVATALTAGVVTGKAEQARPAGRPAAATASIPTQPTAAPTAPSANPEPEMPTIPGVVPVPAGAVPGAIPVPSGAPVPSGVPVPPMPAGAPPAYAVPAAANQPLPVPGAPTSGTPTPGTAPQPTTAQPAAAQGMPGGLPLGGAGARAGKAPKPGKAQKPPKEKKESIWNRPIGGGKK